MTILRRADDHSLFLGEILAQNLDAKDSCVECHEALEDNLQAPAVAFAYDRSHRHRGFSCVDCHGGDPNKDDPEAAMNRARGFLGKIARVAVPKLCARCHSDANLIHESSRSNGSISMLSIRPASMARESPAGMLP